MELDGLLAVCVQHEIDHLEGKLFVDYLSELKRNRIRKKLEKERRERLADEREDSASSGNLTAPLRIVFAGTPDFSVPALDALHAAGHSIVAVYTQPDRPAGRGRGLVGQRREAARARTRLAGRATGLAQGS